MGLVRLLIIAWSVNPEGRLAAAGSAALKLTSTSAAAAITTPSAVRIVPGKRIAATGPPIAGSPTRAVAGGVWRDGTPGVPHRPAIRRATLPRHRSSGTQPGGRFSLSGPLTFDRCAGSRRVKSEPTGAQLRGHVTRIIGFALVPAASFLASLVLLPLISARFGPPAWAALALGQSVGAIASIVIGLTWPVEGGNAVARLGHGQRRTLYQRSVASQSIAFVLSGGATALVAGLLAPELRLETVLFALGTAMNGLSAAWYYSGVGSARPLLVNEGLVRLAGYVVAVVGTLLGAGLVWYAACTVVAGLVMSIANWCTVVGVRLPAVGELLLDGWAVLREQWFGTASRFVQSVYGFGGPAFFAVLAPAQLAAYSGARSVQAAAQNGFSAVPTAFVSWIGSAEGGVRLRRIRRVQLLMRLLALCVFVGVAVLGQFVLDYLFAGRLTLTTLDRMLLAVWMATSFYARAYPVLVLVPLGLASLSYRTTLMSSVAGLVLYAVLIPLLGVTGGLLVPSFVYLALLVPWAVAASRARDDIALRDRSSSSPS